MAISDTPVAAAEDRTLRIADRVRVSSNRWTPQGWESIEEIGIVIDPCVQRDPLFAGCVEVRVDEGICRRFVDPANVVVVAGDTAPRADRLSDPLEREIASALDAAGFRYLTDFGGENPTRLDFGLENGVQIEVKAWHSPRISEQMSRARNVIAVQGPEAVAWLAALIRRAGDEGERPALSVDS